MVFAVTAGMAAFIGNQASAALALPLSLALADGGGMDPRPFAMCVVFAASTSFSTPIGYQTNVMVWGPGNYRFADFVRLGVPLTLVVGVVALIGLSVFYLP
jgi:di/tricarboxylate transporter